MLGSWRCVGVLDLYLEMLTEPWRPPDCYMTSTLRGKLRRGRLQLEGGDQFEAAAMAGGLKKDPVDLYAKVWAIAFSYTHMSLASN